MELGGGDHSLARAGHPRATAKKKDPRKTKGLPAVGKERVLPVFRAYFVVSEDFFEFFLGHAHPNPIRAVHDEDYRMDVTVEVQQTFKKKKKRSNENRKRGF